MGIVLKDLGRWNDALRYYNLALKFYPKEPKILFNKALCYIDLRKYDKARKILDTLLLEQPSNQKVKEKISLLENIGF